MCLSKADMKGKTRCMKMKNLTELTPFIFLASLSSHLSFLLLGEVSWTCCEHNDIFRVLTVAHECGKYNPLTYTPQGTAAVLSSSALHNEQWSSPLQCWHTGWHRHTHTHTPTYTHRNHWGGSPAVHIFMQISQCWGCAMSDSVE